MDMVNIVAPVFLVIGVGFVLGRRGFIDGRTNAAFSKLVFYLAAPALLLRSAAIQPISITRDITTLFVIMLATLLVAMIVYLATRRCSPSRRGVLTQGTHRSNMVFVGLPIIANAFGPEVLGPAAVLIGFMVVVYNLVAVVALTLPHGRGAERLSRAWRHTASRILRNPLIIGSGTGILISLLDCGLPVVVDRSLDLIGRIAMPMALLAVGAGLNLDHLRGNAGPAIAVALIKLVAYPALVYTGLGWAGLRGTALQYPVLVMACPTAVVSYIMAEEMRGDRQLAAAIVIATTVGSLVTIPVWLLVLGW